MIYDAFGEVCASWGEDGGAGMMPLHCANQPHQSPPEAVRHRAE